MKKWIPPIAVLLISFLFVFLYYALNEYSIHNSDGSLPKIELSILGELNPDKKYEYAEALVSVSDYEAPSNSIKKIKTKIRYRGNGSLYLPKPSYKLVFDNKINLLGLGKGSSKEWCIIGQYQDTSLLNSYLAYSFASKLSGLEWTPANRLAELWINGDYYGVFLVAEQIEVGKKKVNIGESVSRDTDIGYLVKLTHYEGEPLFTVQNEPYLICSDLSEHSETKNQQIQYISSYISECLDALYSGDYEYANSLIDIASLVDCYILQEYVMNCDVGWDSFYLYKKSNGKLFFGPVWDFDFAFGIEWAGGEPDKIFAGAKVDRYTHMNYWFTTALDNQWFRELIKSRFNELEVERNNLLSELDNVYNKYQVSLFSDWNLWGPRPDSQSYQIVGPYESYEDRIFALRDWIIVRDRYLTEIFNKDSFIQNGFTENDYIGSYK